MVRKSRQTRKRKRAHRHRRKNATFPSGYWYYCPGAGWHFSRYGVLNPIPEEVGTDEDDFSSRRKGRRARGRSKKQLTWR